MIKGIKNKKTKVLFLITIIGFLVIPKSASADILGIMDTLGTALEGVEEIAGPVAKNLVQLLLAYIVSIAALYTSSYFLQTLISNTQWLSVYGDATVQAAWRFTAGIANMLIILILIGIALSFIFRRESLGVKKTLPKLIMVALLINFSLVFVGALLDISQVFYNTILSGNQNLTGEIIDKLGLGMHGILTGLIAWLLLLVSSFAIPFVGPFAQLGLSVLIIGSFIPNILTWLFQIFSALLISGIFFLFAFLFAGRIFIIQILAILAPLAFLCYILPQTQKYWDQWLQHLLQWIFFGISLLFFLVVGVRLIPNISTTPAPLIGVFNLDQYFVYYLLLFIYLVMAGWLSKQAMPTLAKAVIDQGKALGGAMVGGLRPMGGALKRQATRAAAEQERLARESGRRELTTREKVARYAGGIVTKPVSWAHRAAGTTAEIEVKKDAEKQAESLEKRYGKNVDAATKVWMRDPYARMGQALYLAKVKGAEGLEKLGDEKLRIVTESIAKTLPEKLTDIVKHKPDLIDDEKVGKTVQDTLVSKGMEDKDVEKLIEIGAVDAADKTEVLIRKAAFKKAVEAMRTSDIEGLSAKTLENKDFQEMVLRFKPIHFIRKIGEEKGSEYIEMIRERAQSSDLGAEKIALSNPTLLRQSVRNPAFRAVFPPLPGATSEEEISDLEEKARIRKRVERENLERTKRTREEERVKEKAKRKPRGRRRAEGKEGSEEEKREPRGRRKTTGGREPRGRRRGATSEPGKEEDMKWEEPK